MNKPPKIEGWNIRVRNTGKGCDVVAEAYGTNPDCKPGEGRSVSICEIDLRSPLRADSVLKFLADAIQQAEAMNQIDQGRWAAEQAMAQAMQRVGGSTP